jgi:Zn-dependent protease
LYDISIEILLGRIVGLVIGFTFHEWAHAWSAYRLGDMTAYRQGRLSLDPRVHIEPIGIFLALVAGFGWARPVPVNPAAFYPNEKRGLVLVSLAGPLTNLLIAGFVALFIRVLAAGGLVEGATRMLVSSGELVEIGIGSVGVMTFLYRVLGTVVVFNIVLFIFNLLPLAPLDGYKIAVGTLPVEASQSLVRRERETTLILMLVIMLGVLTDGRYDILGAILGPVIRFFFETLTGFYPSF